MKIINIDNDKLTYGLVFIFFLILYILSISQVLSISHDSVRYLNEIEKSIFLYHPHHLLYQPANILWMKFLLLFHLNIPSYILVASFNCFFGALTLSLLCYLINKIFGLELVKSLVFTSLIGFSFGFWFYSICVEVYVLPIFFIVISTIIYFKLDNNKLYIYLLGVFSGLAVLFHQSHILFGFAILINLIIKYKKDTKLLISMLSPYGITFVIIVIIPYLIIMLCVLNLKTINDMIYWLTFYSHELNEWNKISLNIIFKDLTGFSRTFITPHGLFISDYFQQIFVKLFPHKNLIDDSFIVRNINSGYFILYLSFIIYVISIFILALSKILGEIRINYKKNKNVLNYLYIFIIIYSIFFSFWDSSNQEFWIPQSIFLWISFGVVIKDKMEIKWLKMLIIILVPVIFFINYFFCIRLTTDIENDYFYQETLKIQNKYNNNNVVLLLNNPWIIGDYINRYSKLESYQIKKYPTNYYEIFPNNLQSKLLSKISIEKSILVDFDSLIVDNKFFRLKTKYGNVKLLKDSFIISKNKFYNKDWYLIRKKKI